MKCMDCGMEMSDRKKKRIIEIDNKKITTNIKECWNCGEIYSDEDDATKLFNELDLRDKQNERQRIKIYGRRD